MNIPLAVAAVDKDAPLRLAVAAEVAFPFGGMTAAGLRKEAARGRLAIERIAGKDYTTLTAIEAMRERCRKGAKAPDSGSGQHGGANGPSGSSATVANELALASAKMSMEKLKQGTQSGSPKSTNRRAPAAVIRGKFPSPTH